MRALGEFRRDDSEPPATPDQLQEAIAHPGKRGNRGFIGAQMIAVNRYGFGDELVRNGNVEMSQRRREDVAQMQTDTLLPNLSASFEIATVPHRIIIRLKD